MTTENIQKLQSWDTQLYADCVEFCPFEPYFSTAICGNYQLCESESARIGRLSLHSINPEQIDLTPIQLIDSPGVLDIKWCRQKSYGQIILAMANAIGQIVFYRFDLDARISQDHVQSIGEDGRLALSCDWFEGYKLTVSDSNGEISCLSISTNGSELVSTWKAHEYEAWVASFDRHSDQLIYSGGDDSSFRLWDLRDLAKPVLVNRKAHQMGVTSIETSPIDCNVLATGSYDERLLLWDRRQMKSWMREISLGGGVWKLKWEPDRARYLLAAAMHNGFHVVDCRPSTEGDADWHLIEPTVVASYREHSSLAYGCDWSRATSPSGQRTIATCSFYDHSLQVWSWTP